MNSTRPSAHTSEDIAFCQTLVDERIYKLVYDHNYPMDTALETTGS
jgi:hypothetical protein